jgi:hypothetical protein
MSMQSCNKEQRDMERPLMEPAIFDPSGQMVAPARRHRSVKEVARRVLRIIWRVMMFNPLHPYRRELRVEDGSFAARFIKGFLYRLAFVPVVFAILLGAMVYLSTHPNPVVGETDPAGEGLYFEPVSFLSSDNVPLEAWLVPVIDARRVLAQKDKALQKKYPAVILMHDYGQSRQQVLPLIKPLHEAGLVVLALATRGEGTGNAAAQTFGINESMDAAEAVEMLRRRPFVDPAHIAVVGIGTGANAAVLATEHDPAIHALVMCDPLPTGQAAIDKHIAPNQPWLAWMQPLCKWAFEIGYQVDADEIDLYRHQKALTARPVLKLDSKLNSSSAMSSNSCNLIGKFLSRKMTTPSETVSVGN